MRANEQRIAAAEPTLLSSPTLNEIGISNGYGFASQTTHPKALAADCHMLYAILHAPENSTHGHAHSHAHASTLCACSGFTFKNLHAPSLSSCCLQKNIYVFVKLLLQIRYPYCILKN